MQINFLKKRDVSGKVERFKAGLVAKGYTQEYRVRFMLFFLVVFFDFELYRMDIKTSSLNGDLKEDVYIEKPKGFIPKWDENWVCTSENYMGWNNLAYMWRKFQLFLIFLHHMWIYSFSGNWYWDACCSQTMAIQILKRTSMKHHMFWALK